MRLPDLVAYQAAVQHPSTAFADPQLRGASVTTGTLGLPRAVSGNFAVTYQLRDAPRQWAVRCFHREATDRASRYAAIGQTLARARGGPLVPIEYLATGVRVGPAWYPITKMAWIDGHPLNRAIEDRLSRPSALRDLERRFVEVVADLRQRGIAHGDLQHGNILVDTSGALRLVDYDGMFVPALRGRTASESGDPNYQHPRRGAQFDTELDRFATLVIVVALRAIAAAPGLWQTYNTGDNLLFRRADFVDPSKSALFAELNGVSGVAELSARLARACQEEYARVPSLDEFLKTPPLRTSTPPPPLTPPPLVKPGHVAVLNTLYGPRPGPAARRPRTSKNETSKSRSWKLRRAVVQNAVAFSADGALLATADREGKINVRESAGGRTQRTARLPRSAGVLHGVAYTPSGQLLAVASDGPSLSVWDALQPRRLHEVLCSGRSLRAVALDCDATWLVAGTDDGMLRCWKLPTYRLVAAFGQSGAPGALGVAADGRLLAVAGARGRISLYSLPSGQIVGSLAAGKSVTSLAFTRDGARLVVGTTAGRVTLWDVRTCQLLSELACLTSPLQHLALSSDGRAVGASGRDGSVWLRRLPMEMRPPRPTETPATRVISSGYRLFDWLRRVALL